MTATTTPTSVAELVSSIERGEKVKYVFFWGHQPQADGSVGAGCFSQWWPAGFTVGGLEFATAEHYMMWRKAKLFDDHAAAARVLAVGHPQEAKAVGRTVQGFDDETWVRHRFDIVVDGSVAKFSQHADLRAYLLGTGDRVLVEASPRDRIWGIGMGAGNEHAASPAQWRGLNLLGFALMRARDILRDAAPAPLSQPWMRLSGIVLDSADARELAHFYRQLLGWTVGAYEPGWVTLRAPGDGPGLSFASEPGYVRPTWPSTADHQQMMVHLDIEVEDLDVAGAHAVAAGAVLAEFQPQEYVRVYADPAGHPFCLWVKR